MRSHGVKCHQKIAIVSGLYWQYCSPSVNGPPNVLDRYSRFMDRHIAELRKGLSNRTLDAARIARATRSRARITLTSDIEAVA